MLANDTPKISEPVDTENGRVRAISSLCAMEPMIENFKPFAQPTPKSVALRLRTLRKARGWTLHDIETKSHGSIKSVVMGSYERGTRAISLARCLEIADLFAIPVAELLAAPARQNSSSTELARFDLRRSVSLVSSKSDSEFLKINKFLLAIAARRGDWNGEILTLRSNDLDTLTLILEMSQTELIQWLSNWKIKLN